MPCALGLDFGTSSVRAVLLDLADGRLVAAVEHAYAHGQGGVVLDSRDPDLARQHPRDWFDGAVASVRAALQQAGDACRPGDVVGIGVDGTGSTPVPVGKDGRALAEVDADAPLPALAWLWKDHTSAAANADLVAAVTAQGLPYLEPCGGTHSSEWFWSKLLHAARTAPAVIAAAAGWVELQDFVPAWLCGVRAPGQLRRGICAAGHKGLFGARWGGWPAAAFLRGLHPELARLAAGMPAAVHCAGERAGALAPEVAALFGLPAGIPVAVGALDAHVGAIGAGIGDGDLVKVLGTSSCDMAVGSGDGMPIGIPGIAGVVPDSILPGRTGFEAGQSAVGDLFAATARLLGRSLGELEAEAMALPAGSSGLLALDWHAGNRSVLMDSQLSGLVLGWSLQSTPAEFYRAIVEASAYGARTIVSTLERAGVPVRRIVACGGIAQKSPFVLQVLADVLDREIRVSDSPQACALGAAILGAVAAGAVPTVAVGQQRWCPPCTRQYRPNPRAVAIQGQLFELYTQLHDSFGRGGARDLQPVMKRLLRLREQARQA